ncbi:hypothetical protein G6O69_20255 [Pseudenhygromyxa sp. WMMC2535]|uniref:hypothetical protein n=1 Tax=Pseudenhygromyxa sp. WMMC2535 TaxID=2712867 RepID=UPI0015554982|nr:hypothetical protein [Pseudenhygromyxa sp. WMMC2535]NVB40191.1 hypothetical protein [Pseudenhygromyxa sp. WMMC2535]
MSALSARTCTACALALAWLVACQASEDSPRERSVPTRPALDRGAARAAAVDGLEAAAEQAEVEAALARCFESLLGEAAILEASERALARVAEDPELAAEADDFFAALQDSPAMRAALVDYARAAQGEGITSAGLIAFVDARLTRPELTALLRRTLTAALADAGPALGHALLIEADGAEALAEVVTSHLDDPEFSRRLGERLGDDPQRLARRLGDPERGATLLVDFAAVLAEAPTGHATIAAILDAQTSAALSAASLRRLLRDDTFIAASRELFALALAAQIDARALEAAIDALLALPALRREAAALLAALARSEVARGQVSSFVQRYGERETIDPLLLDALD